MIGLPIRPERLFPPLHPLLLDPTPVWPEPDDDDTRVVRGIVLACILGTLFWVVLGAAWVWLRLLS